MERLWSFATRNFRVTLDCEPERYPDLSWADDETLANLDSGCWQNVAFAVKVYGRNGEKLGADYLGNSIYENPLDFRREHIGARGQWGSYFRDMIGQAIAEARAHLAQLQTVHVRTA